MKIKANAIGIDDPINVKGSVANQDKADEMLIKLLQISVNADKQKIDDSKLNEKQKTQKAIEALQEERSFTKDAFLFLKNILKLTDEQVEAAKEEVDFDGLGSYLNYVIGRLKGQSDEDLELAKKVEEKDPKKE
ncbi:phage tail tube assembly chaperone [Liquorilactobacillus nagelii]|uniref:phage tail tube assembly chaperone n=1 Tax=Liquorilactobacillus nagelii TaxID=82688 RepID=UPI0039EB8C63